MEGHETRREMDAVYSLMGVCPQHDLLWAQLTAADHLRCHGRIKGLKASSHVAAVNNSTMLPPLPERKVGWFNATLELMVFICHAGDGA